MNKKHFLKSLTDLNEDVNAKIIQAKEEVESATRRMTWQEAILSDDMLMDIDDETLKQVLNEDEYQKLKEKRDYDIFKDLNVKVEQPKPDDYVNLETLDDLLKDTQPNVSNIRPPAELPQDDTRIVDEVDDATRYDETIDEEIVVYQNVSWPLWVKIAIPLGIMAAIAGIYWFFIK